MGKASSSLLDKPFLHILLIAIVGFLVYSNTFNVPFHLDDKSNIVDNYKLRDLSNFWTPSGTRWFGFLTFALNYKLHGFNVTGYHIFNILIHIINAMFVYWLVMLTFKTPYFNSQYTVDGKQGKSDSPIHLFTPFRDKSLTGFTYLPLFIALLFVSHPIQTQAVTYITQRFASLATMFYLLSLVMYIKYRSQNTEHRQRIFSLKSGIWYLSSIFSAVLAMETKEISFTLPFTIALYEFSFFGKSQNSKLQTLNSNRFLCLLPFLFTFIIIPLNLILPEWGVYEPERDIDEEFRRLKLKEVTTLSKYEYLLTQFRVIVTYIRILFLPVNQNLDYDYPVYTSFFNPNVYLSFLFLLLIFGLGVYLLYRSRFTAHPASQSKAGVHSSRDFDLKLVTCNLKLIAFGIFWFFITLSIESSIIPIADVIFEHRTYLPSIGAFIAVTTSLFIVLNKLKNRWSRIEKVAVSVFTLIILVLLGTTYTRNTVWKDEIILWEDVVKKSPKNARASYALGTAYQSKGLIDRAVEQYQSAIKLNPDYPEAYNGLGNAYLTYGWIDKTIEYLQIAITLKPDFAEAHCNLGNVYYRSKNLTNKAIEQYRIAITLKPDFAEAHYSLGLIYLEKGFIDDARREFETVLLINPNSHQARQFLSYISDIKSK